MIDLDAALAAEAAEVERRLEAALAGGQRVFAIRLEDAMRHSLLGGGKRLRPIVCLWIHDAAGGNPRRESVWNAALSLEMLHTYSLIHDDLPAMDDDDFRRGRPSCHRAFDEATAILAGDTLQTEAFALLGAVEPPALAAVLVRCLAQAVGRRGMAAGQQLDLDATGGRGGDLETIHLLKTGRLLGASFAMGALCAGRGEDEAAEIGGAGEQLGIAFQIVDDVLDETVSAAELGKTAGKDAVQGKLTAVGALGVDGARADAVRRLEGALATLETQGVLDERVEALARRLVDRRR